MNLRIGRIGQWLAPAYSVCYRCQTPWKFVRHHSTEYRPGHACFPLCEKCWHDLKTPDRRMPYYRMLVASWSPGYARWEDIESAVLGEGAF